MMYKDHKEVSIVNVEIKDLPHEEGDKNKVAARQSQSAEPTPG